MFSDTDEAARRKALARIEERRVASQQRIIKSISDETSLIAKEASMSVAQVAQNLRRQVRSNYRRGEQPVAIVNINPDWRITPGRTAIKEQLAAKLGATLGKDVMFTLDVNFFNGILPAEDENDDMYFYPAGSATLRITFPVASR